MIKIDVEKEKTKDYLVFPVEIDIAARFCRLVFLLRYRYLFITDPTFPVWDKKIQEALLLLYLR